MRTRISDQRVSFFMILTNMNRRRC